MPYEHTDVLKTQTTYFNTFSHGKLEVKPRQEYTQYPAAIKIQFENLIDIQISV